MGFFVYFPQIFKINISINLRRAEGGMAEQFLNFPQICAVL